MVEDTSDGLKEGEIELELGLSIRGGFRKPEESKLCFLHENGASSALSMASFEIDSDPGGKDSLVNREIYAMRRQEARRKREEKQVKKARKDVKRSNGDFDDKPCLEMQRARDRVRDRETKEIEAEATLDSAERECKELDERKISGNASMNSEESILIGNEDRCSDPMPCNASSLHFPAVPVGPSCSLPPHYASFGTGVMPFRASAGEIVDHERKAFQPASDGKIFRPFLPFKSCGRNWSAISDGAGGGDSENKGMESNASSGNSSSAASALPTPSPREGGRTHVGRSHCGRHFQPVNTEEMGIAGAKETPIDRTTGIIDEATDNDAEKKIAADGVAQPAPASPYNSPPSKTKKSSHDSSEKEAPSVVQMPCVLTTGNGPNGRTVTGFLYRYTKSEVTIVCLCHGTSFSPAEFVRHAGGTGVSHPLRHITVVPSAMG